MLTIVTMEILKHYISKNRKDTKYYNIILQYDHIYLNFPYNLKEMMGGKADKGWMTGIKWGKEIEQFKVQSYGMKDFNSSDIILKRGDTWYGVSLKKKETGKAADPTILNKAFTSLLDGDELKPVRDKIDAKTAEFYTKVLKKAMTDGTIKGNPRSVNTRNWKTFMKKLEEASSFL